MTEIFPFKNHMQNVVEKLVSDPFIKNQNWAYLWIISLKCYNGVSSRPWKSWCPEFELVTSRTMNSTKFE